MCDMVVECVVVPCIGLSHRVSAPYRRVLHWYGVVYWRASPLSLPLTVPVSVALPLAVALSVSAAVALPVP